MTDGAPSPAADTRWRGVRGFLLFPALLQPAWALLWHVRDAAAVALMFHIERSERAQIAILYTVLLLGALAFGWACVSWQAFRRTPTFPRLYLWMVLAEIGSVPAMLGAILIEPFMAFGDMLLFAALQTAIGLILALYIRYSKRVRATYGAG